MPLTPEELGARLVEHLHLVAGESVFAAVDGARALPLAAVAATQYGQLIRSLFVGVKAHELSEVAPYLVPIQSLAYLNDWAGKWGTSSGILLVTSISADELYQHLRQLFVAQDERGQELFFRFYDPRVLRVYLPTCTPAEAKEFFGPIIRILVESERPEALLACSPGTSGVSIQRAPLVETVGSTQTLAGQR
jgi:hypothetical protein